MVSSKEPSRVKDISNIEHLQEVTDEQVVRRQVGDGESLPNTPPNETIDNALANKNQECLEPKFYTSPFTLQINIDVMAVMLFLVGLGTRLFRLDQPYNVV